MKKLKYNFWHLVGNITLFLGTILILQMTPDLWERSAGFLIVLLLALLFHMTGYFCGDEKDE